MDDADIRALVATLDTQSKAERDAVWQRLDPLGARALPFLGERFAQAKHLDVRREIAFHCIRHARVDQAAFEIGMLAVADRSGVVRYRGLCVLAYSLRRDALPALGKLLAHPDPKTVADARAGIDAIRSQDHHRFVDRLHSGRTFWEVNPGDR